MIVVAMPEEIQLAGETREPILVTGVGALNVISALRNIPRDTPIRNVGYVGSNNIPIGTRCRIGGVSIYHPVAVFDDRCYKLDGDTSCFTSSDFVTRTDIKTPCVFDMELAYILAMGFMNVTAEKVVSDNLSKEEFDECLKR
jgi:hypothetical protein